MAVKPWRQNRPVCRENIVADEITDHDRICLHCRICSVLCDPYVRPLARFITFADSNDSHAPSVSTVSNAWWREQICINSRRESRWRGDGMERTPRMGD